MTPSEQMELTAAFAAKFPREVPLTVATLKARKRLGDDAIGTCVKQGKFQVHRCTYKGNRSTVTPLSGWLDMADAIAFLDAL